jgi:RNA ligase (TIGR02306 family)
MSRKLATIRTVGELRPIEGADRIELVIVDGWQCVTQKSNGFKVGDLVVYFEIDSVLPMLPLFEFLKDSYVKREWIEGYRLKTRRFKKQLSQGLVLPIHDVIPNPESTFEDGEDLTSFLGVQLWDPPISAQLAGTAKGNFPHFIPKTNQERVQNVFRKIKEKHPDDTYEVTLKLDGSSCTIFVKDQTIRVCSRNLELDIEKNPENAFCATALKYAPTLMKLISELSDIAIQGELMGPGIQGNREGFTDLQFFVFDIFDITRQCYLTPGERIALLEVINENAEVKFQHAPIIVPKVGLHNLYSVEDVLKIANRRSINHPIAEGLVFKSNTNVTRSFKAISNEFLLKENE